MKVQVAMLLLLAVCDNVFGSARHALIIGNGAYADAPLENPRNDAVDIARELRRLGYTVHGDGPLLDLGLEAFERSIEDFAVSLPVGAIALVYYAGHGIGLEQDNFLLPVGVRIQNDHQLRARAVSVGYLRAELEEHNRDGVNLLFLDACRDNPYSRRVRGGGGGLTRTPTSELGVNTFIGYAADEGQVAADGAGRNGIYTGALLETIREDPNREVTVIHTEVARRVYDLTKTSARAQVPVMDTKLIRPTCLGTCRPTAVPIAMLTVRAEPQEAQVEIVNPSVPYSDGMELRAGREYEIRVSHRGYRTWQRTVTLVEGQQTLAAVLERSERSAARTWLYVGLGVLGAGAVAALLDGGTESSPSEPGTTRLSLTLNPPPFPPE